MPELTAIENSAIAVALLAVLSLLLVLAWNSSNSHDYKPFIPASLIIIAFGLGIYAWIDRATFGSPSPPSQLEVVRTVLTASGGGVAVVGLIFAFIKAAKH